jgi:hypothetical protein
MYLYRFAPTLMIVGVSWCLTRVNVRHDTTCVITLHYIIAQNFIGVEVSVSLSILHSLYAVKLTRLRFEVSILHR